ncbi:MAG: patatin-like phospholipase family protein [Armatimonadetes bacterium]|nr:patatin-like phospholipase family protein [Armatimonadota bacterium]
MSAPMRILCIDGGGMKGVYACAYLSTLESHFGKTLYEHFDMVAGTSTGGIIALGIAAKLSAADILEFYRKHGSEIFPKSKVPGTMALRRLYHGHGYGNGSLQRALASVFQKPDGSGPLTMAEAATRVLVPAVNAATSEPRVFKAHMGEHQVAHLTRDLDLPMASVALATAAAPWYLPIARISEKDIPYTYIDGGLWANNPSTIAATEALTYYVGEDREFDSIEMLSIGLPSSSSFKNDARYQRGMKYIDQLLCYAMESSKLGAHQTTKFLLHGLPHCYFRVQPANLTEAQSKRLKLDGAGRGEVEELMMLGSARAENDKNASEIKTIFT